MSFMSTAPRPQTQPSCTSPENGCRCQSSASAGTTSRWPWRSSAGRSRSVLAGDAGDDAGPLGARFEHGGLDADVGEERGHVLGGLALARSGIITPVGRVDADEVGADLGDLVLGGRDWLGWAAGRLLRSSGHGRTRRDGR